MSTKTPFWSTRQKKPVSRRPRVRSTQAKDYVMADGDVVEFKFNV